MPKKKASPKSRQSAVVKALRQVVADRALVANLAKARDTASESGDAQTEDLMVARIQVHEKHVWMLSSFLESAAQPGGPSIG